MPEIPISFGDLRPDDPSFRSPGIIRALNLVPRSNSYGPFRKLARVSKNAIAERALGSVSVRDASDNIYVYVGDENKLYEMVDNSLNDESKAGGYTTAINDGWEFVTWTANNKIIATNYTDPVQAIAIGGGAAGAFANMITSTLTPKAKRVGIIGRFVVLGFTNDATDGEKTNRVWWSGIEDETDFDPSAATQCDFEDLASGGVVQKIIGGNEYGLIFQNNMVRTMRYTGPGPIFELMPLNYAPGTPIPNSVIAHKGNVFYISEDGFMSLRGGQVEHIGSSRVDRFFWDQFDITNRRYVSSAVDPINKLVAWAFPGTGSSSNLPNRILMCKYDEQKWAEAEVDTELLLSTEVQGYTLDGLDQLGTNIDDASVFDETFDSEKWKGGSFRFAAFDQSHYLAFFTGATLGATIDTGDMLPAEGRNWQINGCRVLVDGGDAKASVSKRARLMDSVSYGSASSVNSNGYCPLRSEGKYQRIRLSLSSSTSWSHVQGITVDYVLRGSR